MVWDDCFAFKLDGMSFTKSFEKAFWILITLIGFILAWLGKNATDEIKVMSGSVIKLNTHMERIFSDVKANSERIHDHEKRIYRIEIKTN